MVTWNTITSCCMQPFCLLVNKLLSHAVISEPRMFSEIRNQKIRTQQLALVLLGQVGSAQFSSIVGNYLSWTIEHEKFCHTNQISVNLIKTVFHFHLDNSSRRRYTTTYRYVK